jgi:hypothetical protein
MAQAASVAGTLKAAKGERPNFLFLMVDEIRSMNRPSSSPFAPRI